MATGNRQRPEDGGAEAPAGRPAADPAEAAGKNQVRAESQEIARRKAPPPRRRRK